MFSANESVKIILRTLPQSENLKKSGTNIYENMMKKEHYKRIIKLIYEKDMRKLRAEIILHTS
jgi:hypothetical protein